MKHPEQALQRAVAGYLRGHLVPPAYFSAIGHGSRGGGYDGWLRGVIAKDAGAKRDIPDLYFRRPGLVPPWPSFWIELKAGTAPVPDSQLEFHETLRAMGDEVAVARSVDEVKGFLRAWGFLLSEKRFRSERIMQALGEALADRTAAGEREP